MLFPPGRIRIGVFVPSSVCVKFGVFQGVDQTASRGGDENPDASQEGCSAPATTLLVSLATGQIASLVVGAAGPVWLIERVVLV